MNYIVFDLEATCGKGIDRSEIIEIGAVKLDDNLNIIDTFSYFVKPIINPSLTPFCKDLTSIKQEDVDNADIFPFVINLFKLFIGNDYWLCSWGHYDKKQLKSDCELHELPIDWINNHISLKHQFKVSGGKRVGMKTALKLLDIPMTGTHHRGIDDSINITKIFVKCFGEWVFR